MGRPANSLNKNKAFLLNRLKEMYGADFHPIMKMAENAVLLQSIVDEKLAVYVDENIHPEDRQAASYAISVAAMNAINGWDRIAQYTEPKLKAIDVTGDLVAEVVLRDFKGVSRD